jgi:hypothetical protein
LPRSVSSRSGSKNSSRRRMRPFEFSGRAAPR